MRHSSARHRCRDSRSPLQPPGGAEEPPLKVPRSSSAKKDPPTGDIHYDVIEWWPESKNEPERIFIDIVALHEELIALDNMGRLHQWSWYDHLPYVSQEQGLKYSRENGSARGQIYNPESGHLLGP